MAAHLVDASAVRLLRLAHTADCCVKVFFSLSTTLTDTQVQQLQLLPPRLHLELQVPPLFDIVKSDVEQLLHYKCISGCFKIYFFLPLKELTQFYNFLFKERGYSSVTEVKT